MSNSCKPTDGQRPTNVINIGEDEHHKQDLHEGGLSVIAEEEPCEEPDNDHPQSSNLSGLEPAWVVLLYSFPRQTGTWK